jgi:3-deoxy-manno-octulosonate cytidylyltransferase (CMP-KDO synthetase)
VDHTGANSKNIPNPKAVVIIPARFASSRLPGKALLEIAGKPMVCRVIERALAARNVSRVIVATDDQRIVDAVEAAGHEAIVTRADHRSGTDRLAEVAAMLDDTEIIVNVQGDEPLISPETIDRAIEALVEGDEEKGGEGERRRLGDTQTGKHAEGEMGEREAGPTQERFGIVTTWERIESAKDVLSPAVVKIVLDEIGRAIYFSRSPVPFPQKSVLEHGTIENALRSNPALLDQFRKHTGLYVYSKKVLLEFTRWPQSELERIESLEQLRALEHGVKIKAIEASSRSIGVDTMEDLEKVRSIVSTFEFRVPSSTT